MPPAHASTDLGYAGLIMGADEFFALGETDERYELINGVVLMSPSPVPRHWRVVEEVLMQLHRHADATPGLELDTYAETDLRLNPLTVYRPDLCVYLRPESDIPERLSEPPAVVLEVLSPSSKPLDLITKREGYRSFGVKEYWTIDPANAQVRAWRASGNEYAEFASEGGKLPSAVIPGFALDVTKILRRMGLRNK